MRPTKFLALDVGEKRIGVAAADSATKLAYPIGTINVDGTELDALRQLITQEQATQLIVGYPRNQEGEATKQTEAVLNFTEKVRQIGLPIEMQDESLTSVAAENFLSKRKKPFQKADIDAHAAAIILTDYLEAHYV